MRDAPDLVMTPSRAHSFRPSFSGRVRTIVQLLAILTTTAAGAQTATRVAPDVYALIADQGDIEPANGGFVGNLGYLVGERGVVVIDAGISYGFGERMRATIAASTSLPVALVVLTDPIQEFHFGAAAFQDRGVPVLAHRDAAALIAQRCETCLKRLRVTLGDDAMAGSRVVVPDRLIDGTTTIDVGGRDIELLYLGLASAPGNLAVFDRRSGVLFAGGLVSLGRIPRLRDGDLDGWIAALERLQKIPATLIVPGHGPIATQAEARQTLAYLRALKQKVHALYAKGTGLSAAVAGGDLPAFASWSLYPTLHRENVQELYVRLERADLQRGSR